ncbi:hypothetical protein [Actinoplanes sp. NPDC049118]|uniref:hypothetical protein n=1 Tax=Actinoplanes sp. NPDC049118 TaxID=3155769 RepID=UPI0033C52013
MLPDSRPIPPALTVRRPGTSGTWWWFLIPLLTCGMGTFVMVLIGGVKLRSRGHQVAAAGYLASTLVFMIGTNFTEANQGSLPDWVMVPFCIIPWFGGLAHVLWLQLKVQAAANAAAGPAPWTNLGTDPAIVAAQARAQRRHEARALLASQPALAAELRIGRPDITTRQYDDGGLVDVNHVREDWLAHALELTPAQAAEVVVARERPGGLQSADELVVFCSSITPERVAVIKDRLIFVPR